MSILVNTGFKVGSAAPLNEYSIRETVADRDALVTNGYVYEGMEVYCKDTKIKYRWTGVTWDILDNTSVEDDSSDNTVVFDKSIDTGKYFLLAKITDANYTNNILKFSCPNFKGQNQVGFKYDTDMDILKFELHFNTGSRNELNGYGVTLKQHGLGLYSYPLNDPKNTAPEIKDAVRLYWDSNKSEIYVFLVDLMTAIPHCCLEYTGSGTLLKENTFISDNMYNWNAGSSATWAESKWKSIPYNKLETPPIHDLGGGSAEDTSKDDGYIPNMYDRNANGDIPVVGFDRLANNMAVRQNRGLVSTTETEETYDEDYAGGYVFAGANDILVKDKEMFNKIKVLVHIPGVLRIGIVNDKIYEANPRYSTCLVKWLVADFVAFTGMKEYDIEDTVLEEGQSIFLECRTGVSSWYLNTGEATQVGAVTYPAKSCTTGLYVADKLDTTTNNVLFKSQKVNSSSCLTSFGNNMYSIGGKIRGSFANRAYNYGATSSKKEGYENSEYFGGLNIGLYRRTKYSDTRHCKCIENGMNDSWVGSDTVTKIYAPLGQERMVGKSVYAFKLDVRTPGNLTIYHLKGKSLDTVQVIDKYTHYVRAKGLQTIHLPFDIKLNSTDEYIGFGGLHCKSTSDNIVRHGCQWHYLDVSQAKWMTTIDNGAKQFYSIGLSNTVYPEEFTSFETNTNYLNVELICRGEKRSPLEDKYISFTGDSITTFAGFCTTKTGYPEGNPAGDNAVYYPASGKVINNVDATWWGILARDNRMKILRNDAWSGSRVSSSEGSTDTKCLCGAKRRYYLRNGYNFDTNSTYPFGRPEIIVSMIGTNDLSGNVALGEEMFKGITGAEEEYKTILSAFSLYCRRIHAEEGQGGTKIVHFLIPRGSDYGYANANGVTIADLSLHFERIAKAWGQYFIPISYFNGIRPSAPNRWSCPTGSMFKNYSGIEFPSADGLHPNAMGMEVIADGVHRFLCSIV